MPLLLLLLLLAGCAAAPKPKRLTVEDALRERVRILSEQIEELDRN